MSVMVAGRHELEYRHDAHGTAQFRNEWQRVEGDPRIFISWAVSMLAAAVQTIAEAKNAD